MTGIYSLLSFGKGEMQLFICFNMLMIFLYVYMFMYIYLYTYIYNIYIYVLEKLAYQDSTYPFHISSGKACQ